MGSSHNVMREDHSPDNVTKQAEMLVEKFKQLFHQLDASNCHNGLIDDVYRYDIRFEDSFHQIDGVAAFKDYCQSLYQNISFSSFKFHDQWVSRDSAMLTWTMHYAHPKLKWGKGIYVDGATHLRFDDKVYFHKDYFDGGSLLYEHVPVLGTVIQQLKKRLV